MVHSTAMVMYTHGVSEQRKAQRTVVRSTESLKQFFAGYFHEDWALDDPNWRSVVMRFRKDSGLSQAKALADEIRALLREAPTEDDLAAHLFQELGCYYAASVEWGPPACRSWLEAVSVLLEEDS